MDIGEEKLVRLSFDLIESICPQVSESQRQPKDAEKYLKIKP